MSIAWLNAAAFAGLALVALPIAIHLFVRRHTRTLPYPSLRFLHETALAAFRRQRIQDAALLACRIGIIAAAVAALAAPVFVTPARTSAYAARVARAIVTVEPGSDAPLTTLIDGAYRVARFQRAAVVDALADAVRWLEQQPPATREIVLAGTWRRGAIAESDLAVVPPSIGLRFAPEKRAAPEVSTIAPLLARRNGALVRIDREAQFTADATTVTETAFVPMPPDRIRIVAAPGDTQLAGAALAAALNAGVPWTRDDRRVLLLWPGGDATNTAGADAIHIERPAAPARAASAIVRALEERAPSTAVEPVLIPRERLDEWSRAPGPPIVDAPLSDEGDRRWLWAIALVLIGVEQWLRGRMQVRQPWEESDVRAA